MLANQEDFDRNVKRVLQEVNSEEIPLDFLVDIEQRLDQLEKKKKRRIFMWFFMGILLASGLTFGLLRENGQTKFSVKIAQQNVSKLKSKPTYLSKPKALKELSSSVGNQSIQRTKVQMAVVTAPTNLTKNIPKGSPEKVKVNRSSGKIQSDLIQTDTRLEQELTSMPNFEMTETPRDLNPFISDEQKSVSTESDSAKTETINQEKIAIEEVIPAPKFPEIVMNVDLPKWTHSFGFYTGMSGVISSFRTDDVAWLAYVGAPNMLKYREIRSTQERSTSSIDLSLRYRMAKEHLVLQTGVDFFEWGEQIQYDYSFAYDGINRYSYLSLPIYVGYRQAFHAFEWSANIGCSVGHVLQQQGRYIQPDLVTLALENARTWSATGMAQLEFIYIFDRYRFSLAPTYRMSIGNVVNSTFTKNRYYSFGLQMGMAFQF